MSPFPLPAGHKFNHNPWDAQSHNGTACWNDHRSLRLWQQRVNLIGITTPVTGRFDGATQSAAVQVQKLHGLQVTAVLDVDTWNAVWTTRDTNPTSVHTLPVLAPQKPAQRAKKIPWQKQRANAQAILARNLHLGARPSWYQGALAALPKARSILGLAKEADPTPYLRALQTLHELEAHGRLDTPTAWLLDEGLRTAVPST